MKNVGDITVNDGQGLFDSGGLCDTLVRDLNNLPKLLMTGQYIQFCALVADMAQRVVKLKSGIANDMESMKNKVDEIKRMNDSLVEQMTGFPVEKDGVDNGAS